MLYRPIIKIEDHVTELKIKGFALANNTKQSGLILTISGCVDGRRFTTKTNGHMKVGEIIDAIVKEVTL